MVDFPSCWLAMLVPILMFACEDKGRKGASAVDPDANKPRHDGEVAFEWLEPQALNYTLRRASDGLTVMQGVHPSTEESLLLSAQLVEGVAYWLDFWVDGDGDGACLSPPTDPGFRLYIPGQAATWTLTHPWHLGFVDVCAQPATAGTMMSLTGQVTLGAEVQETQSLKRSQAVPKARVFVQGAPDWFTETDETGNFTLSSLLPTALTADATEIKIVAYYSFYGDDIDKQLGKPSAAKYAAVASLPYEAGTVAIDAGIIALQHTRRLTLSLTQADTAKAGCWISWLDFGFHMVSMESTTTVGRYDIDDLPVGSHRLKIFCPDTATKSYSYEIRESREFGVYDATTIEVPSP